MSLRAEKTEKILWVMCITLFFLVPARTMCHAAQRLSIGDAVAKALKQNPEVHAVLAGLEGAKARRIEAKSAFFPRIDLQEEYQRSNSPVVAFMQKLNQRLFAQDDFQISRLNNPSPRTDWAFRLIFTQPVFNQGREYIGLEKAKRGEEIAKARRDAVLQRMRFLAASAYLDAVLKAQRLEVLKDAVKTGEKGLELAKKRFLAGTALKSDLLSSEARLMGLRQELSTAQSELNVAMANLNRTMGEPQDREWELDEGVLDADCQDRELSFWLKMAKERRPEITISKKMLEVAKLEKKGAKMRFLPSLNLNGIYEAHGQDFLDTEGDSWTLLAKASFNVFNGFGDRARIMEASSLVARANSQLSSTQQQVELEVRGAYASLKASKEAIESAKTQVAQAKEALRILESRYSQGMSLMVEVLQGEDALKEAQLGLSEAKHRMSMSFLRLLIFSGLIDGSSFKF